MNAPRKVIMLYPVSDADPRAKWLTRSTGKTTHFADVVNAAPKGKR